MGILPTATLLTRRNFVRTLGAAGAWSLASPFAKSVAEVPPSPPDKLVRFPEKSELILRTDRPPQLETPLRYFQQDLTPNDAFYVRWHLEGIPTLVNTREFRLKLSGLVEKPLDFSLPGLRNQFEPVSVVAVNQCSGNSRSFFQPRVAGGQWKNGAMGNARWTGVRLRDLLDRTGVKAGAVDVSFGGLDNPTLAATPKFVKSLSIDHARDGEVMVAYEMNGAELPMLNGFPLRLIVPGWYATYWVKALNEIQVLPENFSGYWMEKAYRVPISPDGNESPDHPSTETTPISRMTLRSLFVRPEPGERLPAKAPFEVQGIAFDSGNGIERVEVSVDGGANWQTAQLDPDLGRYSWRRWRLNWTPTTIGKQILKAQAFNRAGQQQTTHLWNRGGYMRNVIEQTEVDVF